MIESITLDKKSLRTVVGKTADFRELSKDCVAFANAKGGEIFIGIENNCSQPPVGQIIIKELPSETIRRINELTINVGLTERIVTAENGGQYFVLRVLPSEASVASTTKGEFLIRDGDSSRAVMPDELIRLMADKTAYCWETKVTLNVNLENCDASKLSHFVNDIKKSSRVSSFVKAKTPQELLEYYQMVDDAGLLTNLGVLWVGKREHRARLLFSPTVQYIKYDIEGNKVDKKLWDNYEFNPKELIEEIWKYVPDWRESNEISDGLWRKNIPAYDEKVVREVLCNAIVHRPYTTRGDIFINLHPDCMKVKNPGQFPLGITAENILQKTQQRNIHLAKIMYDLLLMEKEGSGFDLMYETLLSAGKEIPKPFEGDDYVEITIKRKILNKEAVRLFEYVQDYYQISQKGLISLGLIVQLKTTTAVNLSSILQLSADKRLRDYIGTLKDNEIITSSGNGKGTKYFVNPKLIANSKSNISTSLKTIEPHRLKALIEEDLKYHPNSFISDIQKRLPNVDFKDLQKSTRQLAKDGILVTNGGRKYCKYRLSDI